MWEHFWIKCIIRTKYFPRKVKLIWYTTLVDCNYNSEYTFNSPSFQLLSHRTQLLQPLWKSTLYLGVILKNCPQYNTISKTWTLNEVSKGSPNASHLGSFPETACLIYVWRLVSCYPRSLQFRVYVEGFYMKRSNPNNIYFADCNSNIRTIFPL